MPLKPRLKDRIARGAVLAGAAAWGVGSIFGFLDGFVSLAVVRQYDTEAYGMLTHSLPIVERDASIVALMASPIVALFAILFAVPNVEDGRYRRAFLALCLPFAIVGVVLVEFV